MTITRRTDSAGRSRYQVKVYNPNTGRQEWVGTFDRKRDAEIAESERKRSIRLGTSARRPKDIAFSDLVDQWLASANVRASTRADYTNASKHMKKHFGNRPVSTLTKQDIDLFIADRIAAGLGDWSVKKLQARVSQVLNLAVDWGYLQATPLTGRLHSAPRISKRPITPLTPDQIAALLRAAPDFWRPFFLVAVCTGLRRSELFGLTWDDIMWSQSKLRVIHQLEGRRLIEPKSDAALRVVDLPRAVLDTLSEHRLSCPSSELNLVFPGERGAPVTPSNFYKRVWRPTCKLAGIPDTVVLHDLRRTYASALVRQGRSATYFQTVMGHSSARVTLDYYAGVFTDESKAAQNDLQRWITETTKPKRAARRRKSVSPR
jgi:integrase